MWRSKVKIKHLFTESEDHASIQECMNKIADVLAETSAFSRFNVTKFREISQGDDVFRPVDYANRLLESLYDFTDDNRIWIE
jgi:hypothetical protein